MVMTILHFYFFNNKEMMMGAPKRAVTALMGKVPCSPGSCDIKSQISIMIAPQQMEPVKTILWFDVLKSPLAI